MKNKKELLIYILSSIISKFVIGISGILLARYFTKEDFGLLKTILSITGLLGIFINFGLDDLFLFKISRNKEKYKHNLNLIISTYIRNYLFIFPISLIFYNLTTSKGTFVLITLYLKLFLDWIINIITKTLQSYGKFKIISIFLIINSILLSLPIVYIYLKKASIKEYVILITLSSLVSLIIYNKVSQRIIFLPKNFTLKFNRKILKESFPFFISGIMSYIYMQSDILMISFIKGYTEVARYTVATTLISAAYLFPTVIYNYFLPKLTTNFNNPEKLNILYKNFLISILSLSLPLSICLFIFSKYILIFLYTENYIDSTNILKLLSIVYLFHSICFVYAALLTASGNQYMRSKVQIVAATINIFLNAILIYLYGAEGATLATVLTEIIIFFLYLYLGKKIVKVKNNT